MPCFCRSTFEQVFDDNRVLIIDQKHPGCTCEGTSVSVYSPGVVGNGEALIRLLVAPQHMRKGRPSASALTDAERNGLSMFREQHTSDKIIRSAAEGLVSRARLRNGDKAGIFGALRMTCEVIRSCVDERDSMRAYCVYDTADAGDISHSEAFQRIDGCEAALQSERRRRLFSLVDQTFIPVEQFRNGLLVDLAPLVQ